jgi:hypothetical protein
VTKTELAIGTVVVVGAAVAGFLVARQLNGTDDRPPIEVVEGSIHFGHGYAWADQSTTGEGKRWRPDHPNGKHTKHFDVTVTTNGSDAGCASMQGKEITINYGSRSFTVNPKPRGNEGKDEPELESLTLPLALDATGLVLSSTEEGDITTIRVNQSVCDVSGKPKVRIKIRPKHK